MCRDVSGTKRPCRGKKYEQKKRKLTRHISERSFRHDKQPYECLRLFNRRRRELATSPTARRKLSVRERQWACVDTIKPSKSRRPSSPLLIRFPRTSSAPSTSLYIPRQVHHKSSTMDTTRPFYFIYIQRGHKCTFLK